MNRQPPDIEARQRALAEKLDCTIEPDVAVLAGVQVESVVDWRRRRKGPPYVKFGTTFLYPNVHLAAWLQNQMSGGDEGGRPAAIL